MTRPAVRRRWPGRIISWSRLLVGDFRDPLVGRDILFGAAIGAALMLILIVSRISPRLLGESPEFFLSPGSVRVGNLFFARFAGQVTAGLFEGFIMVFLLLLFVVVLRRERIAVIVLWLLLTVMLALVTEATSLMIPFTALLAFVVVLTLIRFGLLALVSAVFFFQILVFYPITTELTAWYAIDFTIALVIALVLAMVFTFRSVGRSCCRGNYLRSSRQISKVRSKNQRSEVVRVGRRPRCGRADSANIRSSRPLKRAKREARSRTSSRTRDQRPTHHHWQAA